MLAILNSLNAHNSPIFRPILIILISKFMVHRALSDKTYLSLGLLSPLIARIWDMGAVYCQNIGAVYCHNIGVGYSDRPEFGCCLFPE